MSVSEAESLAYFEEIKRGNQSPTTQHRRRSFQDRSRRFGKYAVHSCIDARMYAASTFYPGDGPVLIQLQTFGGIASPDRFAALSMGLVRGLHGHIFVSHWGGDQPHPIMGLDGCGARHASAEMKAGGEVGISGATFIRDQVEPNCIEGALKRAEETSQSSRGPSVAIGLDHLTQWPHLLGIAENGSWRHVVPSTSVQNGAPEIEPEIIRDEYPDIARIIDQGRIFSRAQTPAEIESRKKQDPMAVWISGSLYPTWDVWGTIPLGEMMGIKYARYSAKDEYLPRLEEIDAIKAHASYPYAQASGPTPAFPSTNLTLIDGKTPAVVRAIYEGIQGLPEARAYFDSGDRVVMGMVMRAGGIEHVERLH